MKFLAALTALAAVATAHPFGDLLARQQCENPNRVVSFVVDNSASNDQSDPNAGRWEGVRQLIREMTPGKDVASVVKFNTRGQTLVGNTDVGSLQFKNPPQSTNTDIDAGMTEGEKNLNKAGNLKDRSAMIVVSDGRDSDSYFTPKKVPNLIAKLASAGVRVHWAQLNYDGKGLHETGVSAAVLATGGTFSVIKTGDDFQSFIKQVKENGITNGDCGGNGGNPGGPLEENVISYGLCTNNVQAVYTYTAQNDQEQVNIDLALVSTKNKVTLQTTLENKATGQNAQATVNSGNPKQKISVAATKGQEVTVTVTPSGASSDECQYSVGLTITPGSGPAPSSSQVPVPSSSEAPVPSSSEAPVPSSSQVPVPSSSSEVPVPSSSQVPVPSSSEAPVPSSSEAPVPSSSQVPVPSSSSQVPVPSSSEAPVPSSSQVPTPSSSSLPAPECPTLSASATTIISTIIQTVTAPAPSATASVCLCKCDAPGAQPFPKLEL